MQLFSHNAQAYQAVLATLQQHGRAAVIHPTGTGKSFIAFKWIEDHPDRRFLWLSPSDYIFKTQIRNVRQSAPAFPVEKVEWMTYARLMLIDDDELARLEPDCIILDEFHRCGAECWGAGVGRLLEMYAHAQLLGLSATKIRYLDKQRDMAQELFNGCIASEMTLGEAIVRGILPAPTYVTTLYKYQSELVRYQTRIDSIQQGELRQSSQRLLEQLRRAVQNAGGLNRIFETYIREKTGKYLVFCPDRKNMLEMRRHVQEWFGGIDDDVHCYMAYSADPNTSAEYEGFSADDSDHLKLLFSIDMFNEGIHVPDISGVILFRPTISPIIYKQQIGRALTAGRQGTPLILDIVNNVDGLHSVGTIKSEMSAAVGYLRRSGRQDEIAVEQFEIIEQVKGCIELFRRLESSLASTWDQYFEAASAYRAQYGNLMVPKEYVNADGLCLGTWIQRQRAARKEKDSAALTQEQIERLDGIGMVWENRLELSWKSGYEHARQFYEQFGHLRVKISYVSPDGYKLGLWVRKMRQQKSGSRKNTSLTQERISLLEAIGMIWDIVDENWENAYEEAQAYYRENGHLEVPFDYVTETGFCLGQWIGTQRKARCGQGGMAKLTDERISRLSSIGMTWETRSERLWKRAYAAARSYYEKNGDLKVPYDYVTTDGLQLGRWVITQKSALKHGKKSMSAEGSRYVQLKELGLFASDG